MTGRDRQPGTGIARREGAAGLGGAASGREPLAGLYAGLTAGFVATLAMDGFHRLWKNVEDALRADDDGSSSGSGDDEPSTVKAARAIGRKVLGRSLDDDEARLASEALHFGYGSSIGGLYGLVAEIFPRASAGAGVPYGLFLFVFGDEVMVPTLGLAKPPTHYPPSTHLRALAAHLVYATTLEMVRRGLRASAGREAWDDEAAQWRGESWWTGTWQNEHADAALSRTYF